MLFWDQSPADWHKKHLASCQDWFGSVETGSSNRMEEGAAITLDSKPSNSSSWEHNQKPLTSGEKKKKRKKADISWYNVLFLH